ncbi:hypothetical protein AVEN_98049-1 [Araneus ventricosus]|uniref:Integrase catalytic domain-containing protein n=1 Tax=Araneus ventricosus TaxID=182803 RepID=A0A4Y2WDZ8_ARAVE|nr:hypothetical protein AVEN_98049-1 [Araneus ventricosus]
MFDWDDEVPLHLKRTWEKFRDELIELKHLNIERHVLCSKTLKVELIGFGDAYGCGVYIRSLSTSGEIKVSRLCSKSRVPPIKEVSIPRQNLCRKVVHNCVTCFKVKSTLMIQIMGDLPKERVMKNFPFNVSGIDLCGPFSIKFKNQRKGVYHIMYVCIFICFATKSIHLECISDLTTVSFIETLKRFISRRGKPVKLFPDNVKNFVGASLAIKKLYKLLCTPDDVLAGYLASEEIEWNFLPPRTPNFGGLWEAGVK